MKTRNENFVKDLMEAVRYFSDPVVCLYQVAKAKWPYGPVCPQCVSRRLSFLSTRMMWKCLDCKKHFSVKVGTIFENSAIGLDKWLTTIWLLANCEANGISSYELARMLGVTQRTAWFMLHRIRAAVPGFWGSGAGVAQGPVETQLEEKPKVHEFASPAPATPAVTGKTNKNAPPRSAHQGATDAEAGDNDTSASPAKNPWILQKGPFQVG